MTAATAHRRVLVAGIGNVFLGDDGFGCAVVRRLTERGVPAGVRAVDYGIRGVHLAYDLLAGWDALVIVDAVPSRGEPGALRAFEVGDGAAGGGPLDAHGLDPAAVLGHVARLGAEPPPTVVVGCQVASTAEGMDLSAPVAAAVEPAADLVLRLVSREPVG